MDEKNENQAVHSAIIRGMDCAYGNGESLSAEASRHAFNVLVGEWINRRQDNDFDVACMVSDLGRVINRLSGIRRAILSCDVDLLAS